jgi:hypothetical protein
VLDDARSGIISLSCLLRKQKPDLQRQVDYLRAWFPGYEVVTTFARALPTQGTFQFWTAVTLELSARSWLPTGTASQELPSRSWSTSSTVQDQFGR